MAKTYNCDSFSAGKELTIVFSPGVSLWHLQGLRGPFTSLPIQEEPPLVSRPIGHTLPAPKVVRLGPP